MQRVRGAIQHGISDCPAPEGAGLEASLQPRSSPQANNTHENKTQHVAGGNVRLPDLPAQEKQHTKGCRVSLPHS